MDTRPTRETKNRSPAFFISSRAAAEESLIADHLKNSNPLHLFLKKSLRSDTACGYFHFFYSYAKKKGERKSCTTADVLSYAHLLRSTDGIEFVFVAHRLQPGAWFFFSSVIAHVLLYYFFSSLKAEICSIIY